MPFAVYVVMPITVQVAGVVTALVTVQSMVCVCPVVPDVQLDLVQVLEAVAVLPSEEKVTVPVP